MTVQVSSPMREPEVRGNVGGRGALIDVGDLRADFAEALRRVLCDGEEVAQVFGIRSDRVLRVTIPATVLVLTDRALLVLRESPRLGVRATIFPLDSLGAIELGHTALLGAFWFRLVRGRTGVPQLTVADVYGSATAVTYHTLDEPSVAAFVRRLRESMGPKTSR